MPAMASKEFNRLQRICLALPEAHEQEAWGEPTFRVRGKMFAMFAAPTNHHGRGRPAVWIKSSPVNQDLRVMTEPDTFFVPPYMGPFGWVGMWLDRGADWTVIAKVLREGYVMIAPKALAQAADAASPVKPTVKKTVKKAAKTIVKKATAKDVQAIERVKAATKVAKAAATKTAATRAAKKPTAAAAAKAAQPARRAR